MKKLITFVDHLILGKPYTITLTVWLQQYKDTYEEVLAMELYGEYDDDDLSTGFGDNGYGDQRLAQAYIDHKDPINLAIKDAKEVAKYIKKRDAEFEEKNLRSKHVHNHAYEYGFEQV